MVNFPKVAMEQNMLMLIFCPALLPRFGGEGNEGSFAYQGCLRERGLRVHIFLLDPRVRVEVEISFAFEVAEVRFDFLGVAVASTPIGGSPSRWAGRCRKEARKVLGSVGVLEERREDP